MAHEWESYHNEGTDWSVKHVGPLSYTEDDILIYVIYVAPIPKITNENHLKSYFSKFGEVLQVTITTKKHDLTNNSNTFSYALITFKEPESASKALRCKVTQPHFNIRSADSWKQPFKKRLDAQDEVLDDDQSDEKSSLLNLNDDCLFLIFKYLSVDEHIKLSTLCLRLQNVFKLFYKTTKTLNLANSLTLMDFRQGLILIGSYLENITFNYGFHIKNFNRFINFVPKYCPNLCKLELESLNFKYVETFHSISTKLKHIRHLKLKDCLINDDMVKLLSSMTTVNYLDLSQNFEVSGLHLDKFINLETLILDSCAYIQPAHFVKMCSKTTKIKEMNIRDCVRLNDSCFTALVDNLNELETLTITYCYEYEMMDFLKITKLKKLKHLTFDDTKTRPTMNDLLFCNLAKYKKDQLETLIVTEFSYNDKKGNSILELQKLKQLDLPFPSYCPETFVEQFSKLPELKILNLPGNTFNISSKCILTILSNSPNIEFIDISHTENSADKFIKDVIEILEKQKRSKPLTLKNASITNNIMNKSFLIENSNILKIDTKPNKYAMELARSHFYDVSHSDSDSIYDVSDYNSDIDFDDFGYQDYSD